MPNERTFGFNIRDATELINGIGSGESWHPEIKPRGRKSTGGVIEYVIDSTSVKATGPYTGLTAAQVTIHGAPCGRSSLIGQSVEVIDHSGCIFDTTPLVGYTGWASEMVFWSLDSEDDCETVTPCHWAAINRCCAPNSGDYAEECT
jgi:hypothetical protein